VTFSFAVVVAEYGYSDQPFVGSARDDFSHWFLRVVVMVNDAPFVGRSFYAAS
jgi:hypothetical protein